MINVLEIVLSRAGRLTYRFFMQRHFYFIWFVKLSRNPSFLPYLRIKLSSYGIPHLEREENIFAFSKKVLNISDCYILFKLAISWIVLTFAFAFYNNLYSVCNERGCGALGARRALASGPSSYNVGHGLMIFLCHWPIFPSEPATICISSPQTTNGSEILGPKLILRCTGGSSGWEVGKIVHLFQQKSTLE